MLECSACPPDTSFVPSRALCSAAACAGCHDTCEASCTACSACDDKSTWEAGLTEPPAGACTLSYSNVVGGIVDIGGAPGSHVSAKPGGERADGGSRVSGWFEEKDLKRVRATVPTMDVAKCHDTSQAGFISHDCGKLDKVLNAVEGTTVRGVWWVHPRPPPPPPPRPAPQRPSLPCSAPRLACDPLPSPTRSGLLARRDPWPVTPQSLVEPKRPP